MINKIKSISISFVIFAINFALTLLTILYVYKGVISSDGNYAMDKWNYLNTSLYLSLFTLASSLIVGKIRSRQILNPTEEMNHLAIVGVFGIAVVVLLFLLYPGYQHLQIESDKYIGQAVNSIFFIHTFSFYVLTRHFNKIKETKRKYLVLFLLLILSILLSPYIYNYGLSINE